MKKLLIFPMMLAALVAMLAVPAAGVAGQTSTKASPLDQAWIEEAVRIDLSEIGGGKLALKQASAGKVKNLGQRLLSAHTKSIVQDKAVAKKAGASVPGEGDLTAKQKAVAKMLEAKSGAAFDVAYPAAEVKGHLEAIKGAKLEIANGSDATVIAMAKTDLKMYEMHLMWARAAGNAGGAM